MLIEYLKLKTIQLFAKKAKITVFINTISTLLFCTNLAK